MTIQKKLWLLAASAALGIAVLTVLFLMSERKLLMTERQNGVQQAVDSAYGVLEQYQQRVLAGELTQEQAQHNAMAMIGALRYSGKEYFWINDMDARMLMHPAKPELVGKVMLNSPDADGKMYFAEIVATAKNSSAGGFVSYKWEKEPGKSSAKVSFVRGFAPWGWVLGSGIYLDTVQQLFIERLTDFTIGATLLAGALLAFCIRIARSITQPIGAAVRIAQQVAAGNLTQDIQVRGRDEVGELMAALRGMNSSLVRIVGEVRSGTDNLNTASGQISDGNLALSARTEQQAGALSETAASMTELLHAVRRNADHAQRANELALSASGVAQKGGAAVAEVVLTMSAIDRSARQIADIVGVIDGIAFQTNILALNAAVEAARAGEHGRGFAVVATEVRTLAQRAGNAAKEIRGLIDDSVRRVSAGTELVGHAGQTMEDIVRSVQRVTDIMGDITLASAAQSAGIEQVNQAISQMDEDTQHNAAMVEEAAATAEALQEQSHDLVRLVSVFELGQPGRGRSPALGMTPTLALN
ncbi:methyl-accepting chemotaxis protein [Rugamonas sp.]|uniref:methyl-accepting chemotaxis protein n=1 Tax=Rugamonas sp. TaxID=1926287 RepID=UPI0025DFB5B6|nr:methyl-accepting chemotaxis protein [Rugamonas sp.]